MAADLILYSNAIFDAVHDEPFAGGIAVEGKKILKVGTKEEIQKYENPGCTIKDYGDGLIMPGFIDSHGHYTDGARYLCETAIHDMEGCRSEEECGQWVKAFADEHPDARVIRGQGWYMSYWGKDADFPSRKTLDKYVSDRPVVLTASDLHSIWLNTRACEMYGLKEHMEELGEGHVILDADGQPTGVVRERGFDIDRFFEEMMIPEGGTAARDRHDQEALMHALNEQGITGFSDVSFIHPADLKEHYRHMKAIDDAGQMTIRLYIYPGTDYDADMLKDIIPYEDYFTSDEMHISGVKNILDGVTSTYTAVLVEPYDDRPDTKGLPVTDQQTANAWVKEANRLGLSCRIHCIGDGAVRMALDAYEESAKTNDMTRIRNGIEHIEMIHPDDIARFGKQKVFASMQPRHQILDKGEKLIRCGIERSKYEWNFKSIMDAGGHIALGTDYPVVTYRTYENIYMGVTTRDLDGTQYGTTSRDQVFTLAQALKGYTIEGARLNSMDDLVGTLEPGKYADITVADKNLFAIDEDEIKDCCSVATIFNGKLVYER